MIILPLLLGGCNQGKYNFNLPEIAFGEMKCLPETYEALPHLPSPAISETGRELVLLKTQNNCYAFFDATVENGEPFDYKKQLDGKGNQLLADDEDFPYFARKGVHSAAELRNVKIITGRSVSRITIDGRPWGSSGVGFMAEDETIMSVIWSDNQTVKKMGLTHPDLARPLFHLWNISHDFEKYSLDPLTGERFQLSALMYNEKEVEIKITGSRGWQESIFNDEILGTGHIEIRCDLSDEEVRFLKSKYSELAEDQFEKLQKMLSFIHTGELVFFYINRYGFYEGHTEYRADPVSIAFVFGLRSIEEVHEACGGDLFVYFTTHFTENPE
jgi:hypothetical protein